MAALRYTCPECNVTFRSKKTAPAKVVCPKCQTRFPAPGGGLRIAKWVFTALGVVLLVVGIMIGVKFVGSSLRNHVPSENDNPAVPITPTPPRVAEQAPMLPRDPNNVAIDNGKAYVTRKLGEFLKLGPEDYYPGLISLMGWTLLECGVPAEDKLIQETVQKIRDLRDADLMKRTYSLAPAVLFLDRLGDKKNDDLIKSFALRLVNGQNAVFVNGQNVGGHWGYLCPLLSPQQELQIEGQLNAFRNAGPKKQAIFWPGRQNGGGDNSNTQFAILALWVAKRHDVPTQPVLKSIEQYFRLTQNKTPTPLNGSWSYQVNGQGYTASMTCAGLLALAAGQGADLPPKDEAKKQGGKDPSQEPPKEEAKPERAEPKNDPSREAGLRYLNQIFVAAGEPSAKGPLLNSHGRPIFIESEHDLYFLWSLERICMVFKIKEIRGKDWYQWASSVLLSSQNAEGSWTDQHPSPAGTCFALLVLKRVNVFHDMKTPQMKNLEDIP